MLGTDEEEETKAVDLLVEFVAGRTTDLPQALWHAPSRSIWVRGVYRRSKDKGAGATTHVKMKMQPIARMYPSALLTTDAQTDVRATAYQRIASGFEHLDPVYSSRTPDPLEKPATLARMRVQSEERTMNDVEQVFGGTSEIADPFHSVYQKASSEPGVVRLGACFFTKRELLNRVTEAGEMRFMGRYELVQENHTQHWSPEIRLVVPTTYTRYIEKAGEKNIVFLKGLEYRSDCGGWAPLPMEKVHIQEDDSQTTSSSSSEDGEELSSPPIGSSSPSSKFQKRSCKQYKPGRLPAEQARRTLEEFLTVQEWMDTDSMSTYFGMVSSALEKRGQAAACTPEEEEGGTRIRSVALPPAIFVNEGAPTVEDMQEQLRKMWNNMTQMETELKKAHQDSRQKHQQVVRALHMLRTHQIKRKQASGSGNTVQKKRKRGPEAGFKKPHVKC